MPCIYVLIIALFSSCKEKPHSTAATHLAYDLLIDSANHLYDAGEPGNAIKYLNSVITNYQDLSFNQKFDYCGMHYNYYFHIKKNTEKALYYADLLLKLSKTAKNNDDYVAAYSTAKFYKGDALFESNKYNEAYLNYYQGKLASSKSNKTQDCT
ncbi:hypothetical protein ACFQ3S_01605 [Mucilaginibacter terrae]|uniref:hypothetical protein n=1 Tax=Mucilaginibacter terrae TaxID=1955052 RepID=UPI003640125A